MSYTIKSISGAELYVARDVSDVRAALEAAVRSGANLSGAYLTGAYLSGADLTRANLTRANLSGADLSGAYLTRAYLSGADLTRADLSGAYLSGADLTGAYLSRAYLSRAYLSRAYLSGADLTGANLSGANLSGADLTRANLSGADLSGADLSGADLSGATGIDPRRHNALLMLLDQPGAIRAYKLVDSNYQSPFQSSGKLTYHVGDTLSEPDADTDPNLDCGKGINVATLPWVMAWWRPWCRIMLVEFTAADIAAIPSGDGKFRVRRCTVVKELDLKELGLLK
jgi:uncharacterized protein YjbI with pentapeptide repeats